MLRPAIDIVLVQDSKAERSAFPRAATECFECKEGPLPGLRDRSGAGKPAPATNVRFRFLAASVCCTAVRQLSALRVGSGARYAAPMPNGRFFALRLLVRCAADRRLSALCVGSHVCNAALLSIDCWCILRLLMRRIEGNMM